ncbi:MAG: hypothetical protein IJZ55_09870 [Lachnospiraceae bacterium]|nr:hypothetical protein [Lachnospiraceae bacterium]
MKEKFGSVNTVSTVKIEENQIVAFQKNASRTYSFRVYKDGFVGIHYQVGEMSDEAGYKRAEENLALKRPYPYPLATGNRKRDKCEHIYTDKELLDIAKEALAHICEKYPQFTLSGSFSQTTDTQSRTNDNGMDFENKDSSVHVSFSYKHKDSKNITDGYFDIGQREFSFEKLYDMADNYLGSFETQVALPEEAILQTQYYGLLGMVKGCLDAESLSLGTSLFTGKMGQKLFSEDFTLIDDCSDEECWHSVFWDGEGYVKENDRRIFIDKGVPLLGYSDRRIAEKYNVPYTGNAWNNYTDIPSNGKVNLLIKRSPKTTKELLDGKLSIVLDNASGGGFNEKGDYVMPVHHAFLCDGEKFLGSLPPFTLSTNMFDMFGKDFIGVGSDQPVFNDKSVLMKVKITPNE